MSTFTSLVSALENIYISPLEACNLDCRFCYTKKTNNILTNSQILGFIKRYQKTLNSSKFRYHDFLVTQNVVTPSPKLNNFDKENKKIYLKSILFCGGEIFLLKNFTSLVNRLLAQNIFITIITNGTIDHLLKIKNPQNCQLLVSLDGPQIIHDYNRGPGNFLKTISFIRHAQELSFPVEIMFLVTPQSFQYRQKLPQLLSRVYNLKNLPINYLTSKSKPFSDHHPACQVNHNISSLAAHQIIQLKKNYQSIPPKKFGCFQLALQSDGHIYGCCESPISLGLISDNPQLYIRNLIKSLHPCSLCRQCLGCCSSKFLCGYPQELSVKTCCQVVKLFH